MHIYNIYIYKRSVLRRQSRDTNRNIKWLVYCQYGYYSLTFQAFALRQRETGFCIYYILYILYIVQYIYMYIYIYIVYCNMYIACRFYKMQHPVLYQKNLVLEKLQWSMQTILIIYWWLVSQGVLSFRYWLRYVLAVQNLQSLNLLCFFSYTVIDVHFNKQKYFKKLRVLFQEVGKLGRNKLFSCNQL